MALSAADVQARLKNPAFTGWALVDETTRLTIKKDFVFKDFDTAWAWMQRVVPHVRKADHHPEWFNVYNKVNVVLSTHDAGGVTEKDFGIASEMNRAVEQ